jgi:transcriptional regulator
LVANHLPFFLDRTRGPHGVLMGHVARPNTVWRQLTLLVPSVVIFQGPQSYITPGWYPSKVEHGKV